MTRPLPSQKQQKQPTTICAWHSDLLHDIKAEIADTDNPPTEPDPTQLLFDPKNRTFLEQLINYMIYYKTPL